MFYTPNSVIIYWLVGISLLILLPVTMISALDQSSLPPGPVMKGGLIMLALGAPWIFLLIYLGSKNYKGGQYLWIFNRRWIPLDLVLIVPVIFSILCIFHLFYRLRSWQ